MSLNKRQKIFCDYYIKYNDIDLAIQKANYKKNTAFKLLKKPEIIQYLNNFNLQKNDLNENDNQNEFSTNDSIASTYEIKQYLTKVLRGLDDDKSLIKEKMKAAELLGKTYSIFSNKTEENQINPIIINGEDDIYD